MCIYLYMINVYHIVYLELPFLRNDHRFLKLRDVFCAVSRTDTPFLEVIAVSQTSGVSTLPEAVNILQSTLSATSTTGPKTGMVCSLHISIINWTSASFPNATSCLPANYFNIAMKIHGFPIPT